MKSDISEGYIYKYRAINEYTYQLLINKEMWFAEPDSFNDPFDCNIHVDFSNNQDEIKDYFKMYSINYNFEKNEKWKYFKSTNFTNYSIGHDIVQDATDKIVSGLGILALSKKYDDILMWSHYSNAHTGVCLEFDILKDKKFFKPLKKVDYKAEYPNFRYLEDKNTLLEKLILTKSEQWNYEQEYRIIRSKSNAYKFRESSLKSVYFGYKCSELQMTTIMNLVKETFTHEVVFYRMELNKRKFELTPIIVKASEILSSSNTTSEQRSTGE